MVYCPLCPLQTVILAFLRFLIIARMEDGVSALDFSFPVILWYFFFKWNVVCLNCFCNEGLKFVQSNREVFWDVQGGGYTWRWVDCSWESVILFSPAFLGQCNELTCAGNHCYSWAGLFMDCLGLRSTFSWVPALSQNVENHSTISSICVSF